MACEPFHDLGSIFSVREVLVTLALTPTRIGIQPHLAGQRRFSEHRREFRSWRHAAARECASSRLQFGEERAYPNNGVTAQGDPNPSFQPWRCSFRSQEIYAKRKHPRFMEKTHFSSPDLAREGRDQ